MAERLALWGAIYLIWAIQTAIFVIAGSATIQFAIALIRQ